MPKLGLIGKTLKHSFSRSYFRSTIFTEAQLKDWDYLEFPLESISLFKDLWRAYPDLRGVNVTIPYKEEVIPFLDDLDDSAQGPGAVNTVRKFDGKLIGYNTDIYGFKVSLMSLLGDALPERAFILGTGGASKAVKFVLEKMGIPSQTVSRSKEKGDITYPDLRLEEPSLIINTTPLGTFPNNDACPDIKYSDLSEQHYLYDLVYNPPETLFLKQGREKGAKTLNGLPMLRLQAWKSWEIWTGNPVPSVIPK